MNSGRDLFPAYRFRVEIGIIMLGFRSVSGIKLSAAFEPLSVGGLNNTPVMLPVPVKDTGKIVLEQGISPLVNVVQFVPGTKFIMGMKIDVIRDDGRVGITYLVSEPVVESVEFSKLDAETSAMLIQTLTFHHSGITVMRNIL